MINVARVVLILVGLVGAFLVIEGLGMIHAGVNIVLPGLGLVVGGGAVLLLGLLIIAFAAAALILLSRARPYR
jgi:hypothetical protein